MSSDFMRRIAQIDELPGGVPPSEVAIRQAATVCTAAARGGLVPRSVVPDIEGGVAIEFASIDRRAGVYCDNDGDITVLFESPDSVRATGVDDSGRAQLIGAIQNFLSS